MKTVSKPVLILEPKDTERLNKVIGSQKYSIEQREEYERATSDLAQAAFDKGIMYKQQEIDFDYVPVLTEQSTS